MAVSEAQADPSAADEAGRIGVMIVDDSAVARGLLARWVDEDPELRTVGRYANGRLAVDGLAGCAPDVVLLDIEMPVMDGMAALPQLLDRMPGVKVIVTSTLTRRNAEISMRALSLGATDYVTKPEASRGITAAAAFRDELIRKVKAVMHGAAVRRRVRRMMESGEPLPAVVLADRLVSPQEPEAGVSLRPFSAVRPRVVTIGSSTGGPQTLTRIAQAISPVMDDVPVLVAQHMPPTFTAILAEHLFRAANRTAKEGEDGETLRPGVIYVAPGGRHMSVGVRDGFAVLRVHDGPAINFCRPAVDPMFQTAAEVFGGATLGLVLTGMGHDGAAGARAIAEAGGSVIAQDIATSVVWGMPGAAVAAGACAAILPAGEIGAKVGALLRGDTP